MSSLNEEFMDLINETVDINEIRLSDIPSIYLYADQITTYMEENLNSFRRYPRDKILTKTMINNYAKAKVLPAPIGKKYSKNHLMLLIIIYHLKSVLSISDINKLLTPITRGLKPEERSKNLEKIYDYFVTLQEANRKNILSMTLADYKIIDEITKDEEIENESHIKLILAVLYLTIKSDMEKRLAEKIIDRYFAN